MAMQEQERRSLPVVGSSALSVSSYLASPHFQRKPRSHHLPRAAPSRWWDFKLPVPVLPPAPAKKRVGPCALCGATETPRWRTWPTDCRVVLCNGCGIQVRKPGTVLPELVYLRPPAMALPKQLLVDLPPPATARTAAVSELEHPHPQEMQDQDSESSPPDSPILDTTPDVYMLRRTSPRRDKSSPPPPSPPPLPTAEPASAAAALAPGNKPAKNRCQHCSSTSTLRWRTGPAGEGTLCNPCGVTYRKGRLVPEYRPKASPTFDVSVHSNQHREVLQIRRLQDAPEPPAQYEPIRARTTKHRIGTGQQQQPRKKRLVNKKNQQRPEPAATRQPRASDEMEEHLPPPAAQPHAAGNELMVDEPMPRRTRSCSTGRRRQ